MFGGWVSLSGFGLLCGWVFDLFGFVRLLLLWYLIVCFVRLLFGVIVAFVWLVVF